MQQYFSNSRFGQKISNLRRQLNWTQGELAEQLGVSHQAVSSWEKGQTCPDISKLSDLSRIFKVSIDELLDNPYLSNVIEKIEQEEFLQAEEVVAVSAITKPQKLDHLVDQIAKPSLDAESMICLAPFVDDERIEEWAQQISSDNLIGLAPYLDRDCLSQILSEKAVSLDHLLSFAPYLESDQLTQIIEKGLSRGDKLNLVHLAPFLESEQILALLRVLPDQQGTQSWSDLAPFIDSEDLHEIFQLEGSKIDERQLVELAPFMESVDIYEVLDQYNRKGQLTHCTLTKLLPFIESDDLSELIRYRLKTGTMTADQAVECAPYIEEEDIQEIFEYFVDQGQAKAAKDLAQFL